MNDLIGVTVFVFVLKAVLIVKRLMPWRQRGWTNAEVDARFVEIMRRESRDW